MLFGEYGEPFGVGAITPNISTTTGEIKPTAELFDFKADLKHNSAVLKCREILGADVIGRLMDHASVGAPHLSKDQAKTMEARQTYLQVQEQIEAESQKYGSNGESEIEA